MRCSSAGGDKSTNQAIDIRPILPIHTPRTMEKTQDSAQQAVPRKTDHRIKIVFVVLLAALGVLIYWLQLNPKLPGWGDDLQETLGEARREGRKIVVLFTARHPGETTRRLMRTTLAKPANRQAIEEGNFIRIRLKLDTSLKGKIAKQYKIKNLPTMLVLSPGSRELNRREGMIGEMAFRKGFLDCAKIAKP